MNPANDNGENSGLENTYQLRSTRDMQHRYMQYRDRLLENGFSEAKRRRGHFYLEATEKTAFIVNLYNEVYCLRVLYGFASTAYMAGCEEWFSDNGSEDTECQVRNILYIYDENSEKIAEETISAFYTEYKDYSKDEILNVKKERQKAFLNHFSQALKPLGFRKKNTRWTKDLNNGLALSFEAQKSAFSDQYYFNVIVHEASSVYMERFSERVVTNRSDIYNWQLMNEEQIAKLIQRILTEHIIPKI